MNPASSVYLTGWKNEGVENIDLKSSRIMKPSGYLVGFTINLLCGSVEVFLKFSRVPWLIIVYDSIYGYSLVILVTFLNKNGQWSFSDWNLIASWRINRNSSRLDFSLTASLRFVVFAFIADKQARIAPLGVVNHNTASPSTIPTTLSFQPSALIRFTDGCAAKMLVNQY